MKELQSEYSDEGDQEYPVISDVRSLSIDKDDATKESPHCNKALCDQAVLPFKTKKFSCDICGRSFTRPTFLKSHILVVHRQIKTYKCETCGKGFEDKNKLKQHERIWQQNCKVNDVDMDK